ncbi:MAG: S8 family serine peptidase [Bacteroidia bacterium]|nr:S8 family serine peptidase [Bacteroidia bacterium]
MKNILFLVFTAVSAFSLQAQNNDWIVKFDKSADISLLKTPTSDITEISLLSKSLNVYNVKTSRKVKRNELQAHFKSAESISENLNLEKREVIPNDLFYADQWNLKVIAADKVWEETTGGKTFNGDDIVIAVMDDGFDVSHSDLKENYWINNGEIPGDGLDNDGNGYIDDVMGVNIQNNTGVHAGVSHGTLVSGILGAKGDNGLGIAGINWDAKILLVSGVSNIGEIIKSLEYIYDLKKKYIETNGAEGANVVVNNFSGGIKKQFPSAFPSWCEQYEILGEVGILSVGAVANENFDVEIEGDMPTLCNSDYLIMVTNTNINDVKVSDAAFGTVSVDLGAPGEVIISSEIGDDYDNISGTSASAPHVAGAIALLYSIPCQNFADIADQNPSEIALTVKRAILDGVDDIPSLSESLSGGRLNIFNAVFELNEICGSVAINPLEITKVRPSLFKRSEQSDITFEYDTDVFTRHTVLVRDNNGRLVIDEDFKPLIFGNREYSLTVDHLDSGIYFLSVIEGDKISTERFVVVD